MNRGQQQTENRADIPHKQATVEVALAKLRLIDKTLTELAAIENRLQKRVGLRQGNEKDG